MKVDFDERADISVALVFYVRDVAMFLSKEYCTRGSFAKRIINARKLLHKFKHMDDYAEKELGHIFRKAERVFHEEYPDKPLPFSSNSIKGN